MPRVVLDNVGKVFQTPGGQTVAALSSLSLSIEQGECLSLVGPSGSGKTTALRLIAGLDLPTTGSVTVGNQIATETPFKDLNVAMVFQQPALYPHMTVAQNLGFGLKLRKWSRLDIERRVLEVAELLGLASFLACLPESLSGGQRQRVAIGRALARRASVLLLDEPLANIDPTLRNQMRSELVALRKRFGTTLIYVTHDHIEAMLMGDRVAVLHQGVLQQVAPPIQVYQAPANLFVANFVGFPSINLITGSICRRNEELWFLASPAPAGLHPAAASSLMAELSTTQLTHLKSRVDQQVVLGFRPEKVGLAVTDPPVTSALRFQAAISSVEHSGPDLYVKAACEGLNLVARVGPQTHLNPGESCSFLVQMDDCSWFDPASGTAILHSCAC